jgi:PAS domain S-box-containing protein
VLDSLDVALYTTDAAGRLAYFNEAAVQLWGRRPTLGEERWCGSWRIHWPDGSPVSLDEYPMAVTVKTGAPVRGVEVVIERPDGSTVPVTPYPSLIYDRDGSLLGAVNVLVEITRQKQTEEANRRLAALVESSQDAVVAVDRGGVITSWNRAAQRLYGYSEAEALGQPISLIVPADRRAEAVEVLALVRNGQTVEHFDTMRRCKDGTHVPVSLTVSPIKDETGQIIGASKVARDIRERRAAEEALRQSIALKDQFLGLVSHELKNPITTIVGNGQLLQRLAGRLSESESKETLDALVEEASRLGKTIDNLLSLTRLDAGAKLDLEPVQLAHLVGTVIEAFQRRHPERSVSLEVSEQLPLVLAEPDYLTEVLENLLSNAHKYSPSETAIEVGLIRTPDHGALVQVRDRGVGISERERKRLFTPFYRSDAARKLSDGLGLGLTLSQRIIQAHGGEIECLPRAGGGTQFQFALPGLDDAPE